ncbi:MAG: glycosyltransferase family 4 protein [Thermoleophilia bacterium]|nr:glycosyltransferase family 4 protein [Thermoleophilia bacterium]
MTRRAQARARPAAGRLDIVIVTQMYPGPDAPDLGIFVRGQEIALRALGHRVRVIGVTRRGGGLGKHLGFAWRVMWGIARRRPDVVYAHFLAPAGALAAAACQLLPRTALVVVAHGRDVRNIGERPALGAAMRLVARRADCVVAVSGFLARELERRLPPLAGRVEILDAGVDVETQFTPGLQHDARVRTGGWENVPAGTAYVFVGTLDTRKNVLRLADAFERLGSGSLTFVGDGPLRVGLEGRPGVRVVGPVAHQQVVDWMRSSDVLCLPSLVEPFGQVLIEAMGCERSVVATCVGGPVEFVGPEAGVLVDPLDVDDIERGLRAAALLPTPNLAARSEALQHDVRRQVARVEQQLRAAVAKRMSS